MGEPSLCRVRPVSGWLELPLIQAYAEWFGNFPVATTVNVRLKDSGDFSDSDDESDDGASPTDFSVPGAHQRRGYCDPGLG